MKNQTFYIYEEPFNGIILNTMQNGLVNYTGDEKTTKRFTENGSLEINISYENKLTFEEYIKDRKLNPKKIKTATDSQINELFKKHEENERTGWKEISEERADEMLNVLPPWRFTKIYKGYFFFISEAYSGNNHACFAFFNGKYYESLRSIKESTESIINSLRNLKK
jgi:hypothetical protein